MGTQRRGNSLGITWTDETLNPLSGCSKVSPGCKHCWASDASASLSWKGQAKHDGLTVLSNGHHRWNGTLRYSKQVLAQAFQWRTPRKVFLNSMSDTFHEKCKREWQDEMFEVMAALPHITWQLLTKRPKQMIEYLQYRKAKGLPVLPQVHLGFSAETQALFDERWAIAREASDAGWLVWTSIEPQLERISVAKALDEGLAWVVTGGENTKPYSDARPYHAEWAELLVTECRAAQVPVFVKQMGVQAYRAGQRWKLTGEGKHMLEWPDEIRVQEFPANRELAKAA